MGFRNRDRLAPHPSRLSLTPTHQPRRTRKTYRPWESPPTPATRGSSTCPNPKIPTPQANPNIPTAHANRHAKQSRLVDAIVMSFVVAQILVRQLDDDTKAKLQRLARQHGRSTEKVREILRNAVRSVAAPPTRLGSRIASRFAGIGLNQDIPELRGQSVRPATFDESWFCSTRMCSPR